LKAIGATIVTKETEIDRIVATQNTPAGEVWYLYQSGSGNSENMGSYRLTTVAIAPFPREVEVRSMPDGLQQPGKTCANPPWLVRQFASYRLDRCDYQDFAPLKIELPGGPKELSGRVMVTKYVLADPPHIRLPIAIWRNYVTALQEIGAKLVTDPKNTSLAVLTQTDGAGEYWYIYRNAGGNDEGTGGYSLSTLQIGGPPPKACTIQVYGVNFDFDKSVLRPDSEPVLLQVLALFTAMPSFSAEVGGHTDNVGQPPYNLKLSDARAAAVKTWLTQHGVAPTRLSSRGYGDTRPLVPNTSDENRFKNRRVELKRPNCS
jgi:outer membrane protein OmpA-like peptidoglycan-associated protein